MASPPTTNDVAVPNTTDWKTNNTGSKLLAKMGWTEGEGVGKRHRTQPTAVICVKKRSEGLGLGANSAAAAAALGANSGGHDLGKVLEQLNASMASSKNESDAKGEKKKKSKKHKKERKRKRTTTTLPTNRVTHAGIRAAKFQAKTADDMKCIFGGGVVSVPLLPANGVVAPTTTTTTTTTTAAAVATTKNDEYRRKRKSSEEKKRKKARKDEC